MLAGPSACALVAGSAMALLPATVWTPAAVGPAAMIGVVIYAVIAGRKLKLRQADPHTQALFGVGITLAYAVLVVTSGFWPGGWGGAAIPLTFFIIAGGVQVMIFALRTRRVGDSLHCPKCDYELGVDPASAPNVCPECATAWHDRWITGARTRSVPLAATGAVLCFIGLSPLVLKFGGLGAGVMTLAPNALLITTAATDAWGHNKATWGEVGRRTFTQEETDRLAAKLLDVRRGTGYLYGPPAAWLEAAAAANSLSPDVLRRYYDEWFEPEIDLPDRVSLGQLQEISVRGEERGRGPGTRMFIWVQDVRVNGVPLANPGVSKLGGRWIYTLYRSREGRYSSHPDDRVPSHSWTPAAEGSHEVELTLYQCVVPSGTMPTPATEPDGRPTRPAASTHFEQRTLRKTVEVVAER
ncbi:MAG TPA: hypothetical protein VD997_08715 [Phycisphaerales bacterium]|nr:hypothetical protein [Phycisphaerales bacterium]